MEAHLLVPARFIQSSDLLDLAAIGVAQPGNRSPVPMVPIPLAAESCEEGDEIGVCGFPLGDALIGAHPAPYFSPSFSSGIVSASLSNPDADPYSRTFFRMDMMINPGNSGGRVFDLETGAAVGVAVDTTYDPRQVIKGVTPTDEGAGVEGRATEEEPPDYYYISTGLAHAIHTRPWTDSLIEGVSERMRERYWRN